MRHASFFSLVVVMAAVSSTPANAVVSISVDSGNLAAFSYTVDSVGKVIDIYETWGPATDGTVILRFDDWNYGNGSWIINKYVLNDTGATWNSFAHELLQTDYDTSHDEDGLSFAQLGVPLRPRTSDKFADVFVDEVSYRDYLKFHTGSVATGTSVYFTYGLTARRDTDETDPFYLRQSEFVVGVPEPATWAMLVSGFGLVGFAARRRRMIAQGV